MELRVIATDKKFQRAPYFITPKFDEKKKKFLTGQNVDWIEDKKDERIVFKMVETEASKKLSFVIDPNESYPIRHLQIFNTDVESDMLLLNLFKSHDHILAPNKKGIIPGVHQFYIEDKEEEAISTVSKVDMEYNAMTEVKSLNTEDVYDLARLLAVPKVGNLTEVMVRARIFEICKTDPARVLSIWSDSNRKAKIFLRRLIEKNIIRIHAGKYTYGEEILGLNEISVLDFLKDKQNTILVNEFAKLLKQEPVAV